MVTLQLRELEADGIVARTIYPEIPPKVEYALTAFGRTLEPILIAMREWGRMFQADGTRDVFDGEVPAEALHES